MSWVPSRRLHGIRVPAAHTCATLVLLHDGRELIRWPLAEAAATNLALVDRLARLQLESKRRGFRLEVRGVGCELAALLHITGLAPVLCAGVSSVEVSGQAEQLEEPDVQEVVMPDDPVA